MGESLLAILFEGGTILLLPASQVNLGRLYAGALFGVALSFSFKVFYADIDNQVLRRGTHAVRWHRNAGLVWSLCHFFFHAALILAATGLGLTLRGAAVRPSVAAAAAAAAAAASASTALTVADHAAVAATATAAAAAAATDPAAAAAAAAALASAFDTTSRWVFSAGTFGALLVLVALSLAHRPGPRAATRPWRLGVRVLVSVASLVGLPLVSGERFGGLGLLGSVAAVVSTLAFFEYVLLEMDRIGWFRSELSLGATAGDTRGEGDDEWELGPAPPGSASLDGGAGGGWGAQTAVDDEGADVEGGRREGQAAAWGGLGGVGDTTSSPATAGGDAGAPRSPSARSSASAAAAVLPPAAAGGDADEPPADDGLAAAQPGLTATRRRARFWATGGGSMITTRGSAVQLFSAESGKGGCAADFF